MQDLIDKLLKVEPSERFDADQALQHPFLKKWQEQSAAELSSLEPELRKFEARQKFRVSSTKSLEPMNSLI